MSFALLGAAALLLALGLSGVLLFLLLRRPARAGPGARREMTTLLEILDTITSSLDVNQVAKTIVDKITKLVPAVRCSILYIDESQSRCFVMASHDNPKLERLELDLQKYPEIQLAMETRDAIIVQDISKDPLMAEVREPLEHLDYHSIIVIPLTYGDDLLGTLCLKSARRKQEFSKQEINFCTAVARASANALKNALLHRQIQEESRENIQTKDKLVSILKHSPDLILSTDNRGYITEFNRGAEKLLGYRKQEVVGRPFEVLWGEGRDPNLVDRIRSEGVLSNYECQLGKKDGSPLAVELNMAVLKSEADEVIGTVWVGRDVTDLKAAQVRLLQAEKMSGIGEVISGVAHELNNPLSGVLGYSQLLMARHGNTPIANELEKINESALRCQKIVKNLLSFARKHAAERKYLGVNGILDKTLELRKYQLHAHNIEVIRHFENHLPRTMLDFHQMQQVFLNLITNAQHAIAAARRRHGRLTVRTAHTDGTIRIEITDNGEGMDDQTLQRVFDPFFTTKEREQGTGLGLSVSYGIVKDHGGRIEAVSGKDKGATFVVELPVCGPEREESNGAGASEEEARSSAEEVKAEARILVVDDEPIVLDLLMDLLGGQGYQMDTANNGGEAYRKICSRDYDVMITDVRMPQMNGMELFRKVVSTRPQMKERVIFITGDLNDLETVSFLAEIEAPTIPKPLDIREVLSTVEKTLAPNPENAEA